MSFLRAAILVGVSLSIGWGVRGNFGHEYGAMLPGVLAAIAGVLMLGSKDWLVKLPIFGFFGALGWAFGGSISYMQVISYTHSGDIASVFYGFAGLFLIGFLWACMGGMATAWTAEASTRRLIGMFRPLTWIFILWILLHFFLGYVAEWESNQIDDRTWQRQASVLYWMDSDWIAALTAGIAIAAFELWDMRSMRTVMVGIWAGAGAAIGWSLQKLMTVTGMLDHLLVWPLVQYQADGDLLLRMAKERTVPLESIQADALTNWPNCFQLFPQHVGWVLGLILGLLVYLVRNGRFRSGSGLYFSMVVGWFIGLVLMPVMLGFGGAGLRMTPPRGDNWAGIVGLTLATIWWLGRHGYFRVIYAGVICGLVGGFGFAAATFAKLILVSLGNPNLTSDSTTIQHWQFWQQSNWHSFLEQSYGLINGLGVFLALIWLRTGSPRFTETALNRRLSSVRNYAIVCTLLGVIFLNMRKNILTWIESGAVPKSMRLPGFANLEFDSSTWFNLAFAALTTVTVLLIWQNRSRPLAWLPTDWVGRGQLFYLCFLWIVVVMNFERALVGFSEGRLLTEGVIFVNALWATWMISCWPAASSDVGRVVIPKQCVSQGQPVKPMRWVQLGVFGVFMIAMSTFAMPAIIRLVYGDHFAGHAGMQKRFGPDALWRTTPIFKSKRHS